MNLFKTSILGFQILVTAFGALVLVPILTGLEPSMAFIGAGVGTLVFQLITKREVPIFLGSSFAFIPAMIFGIRTWGVSATLGGLCVSGMMYFLMAFLVKQKGVNFIEKIFPYHLTGPIIMLIGMLLAPIAVQMAKGQTGDGINIIGSVNKSLLIAFITLTVTASLSIWGKGFWKLTSILSGLASGYFVSLFFGAIDFAPVATRAWFEIPKFTIATFEWAPIIYILPVAIAPMVEHFGDMMAISNVTGKNFIAKPGIHRTLVGDGVASMLSTFFGGPPNTTYSEVTGAVSLIRIFDPKIMTAAAIISIALSFVGKLGALLSTIPLPVMGGLLLVLFGNIIVIGLNMMIKAKVDLDDPKKMIIVGLILVLGIGGMSFEGQGLALKGVSLAAVMGIILNFLLKTRA